jgi:hypothetical protein
VLELLLFRFVSRFKISYLTCALEVYLFVETMSSSSVESFAHCHLALQGERWGRVEEAGVFDSKGGGEGGRRGRRKRGGRRCNRSAQVRIFG